VETIKPAELPHSPLNLSPARQIVTFTRRVDVATSGDQAMIRDEGCGSVRSGKRRAPPFAVVGLLASVAACALTDASLPTMDAPEGTCAGGVFLALRFEVAGEAEPTVRFVPVGGESPEPVSLVWPRGYRVSLIGQPA
jgi:hypothetical protein